MRATVPSTFNSCPAGTHVPFLGAAEIAHGFASISVRATSSASCMLQISIGATVGGFDVVESVPLYAGVPVVVSIAVVAQYYKVEVLGSGAVEVETLLHTAPSTMPDGAATETTLTDVRDDRRLTLTTATTAETVVSDGNTLSHTVSLGTAMLNHNCAIGIYTTSTDSTTGAFAVDVSHNGTDWLLHRTYTANTTNQFNAFPVEGWRHLRVTYSNNSGVNQTIGIDSSYWN